MENLEEIKKLYSSKQSLNNIRDNYFNQLRSDRELEQIWFDKLEETIKALDFFKRYFTITEQRQVQHKNLWNLTPEEYNLLKEVLL